MGETMAVRTERDEVVQIVCPAFRYRYDVVHIEEERFVHIPVRPAACLTTCSTEVVSNPTLRVDGASPAA